MSSADLNQAPSSKMTKTQMILLTLVSPPPLSTLFRISISTQSNIPLTLPTDSSISTSSLPPQNTLNETLSERILALRDMVPPSTRRRISTTSSRITQAVIRGAFWGGKGIYVLSTGLLMVGIPWALAFVDEQQALEIEQEQKAREAAGEVSWFILHYLTFFIFLREKWDLQRKVVVTEGGIHRMSNVGRLFGV